ncbi:MAG: hypothetical protein GX303_01845 [Clostridiales bacterium]|nr:hypothetical protein [Clostridiales bacterium]
MLKGCQRKIILLRNTGSNIFEEAYFVLKADAEARQDLSESDMVSEARRIVEANTISLGQHNTQAPPKESTKNKNTCFGWFLAGCVFSCLIVSILLLIF